MPLGCSSGVVGVVWSDSVVWSYRDGLMVGLMPLN